MKIDKAYLIARKIVLEQERDLFIAEVNARVGSIKEVEKQLADLDKQEPEKEPKKK